jgi:hypothetical protein
LVEIIHALVISKLFSYHLIGLADETPRTDRDRFTHGANAAFVYPSQYRLLITPRFPPVIAACALVAAVDAIGNRAAGVLRF